MGNPPPPAPQGYISCWQGYGSYVVVDADQRLMETNTFVGDYPAKVVVLHYDFVKLQLNSLPSHGASTTTFTNPSPLRKDRANISIYWAASAASALAVVLEESPI